MIKNVKITNLDYSDLLREQEKNVFIYLDPPYDLKKSNLYGKNGSLHKGFNHMRFYENFKDCKHKCMVTYNCSNVLLERYKSFKTIEWNLKYGMSCSNRNDETSKEKKTREGKELLIMNY